MSKSGAVPSSAAAAAQLAAYNARDLEAFCAVYADDVVLTRLAADEPFVRGQAELRARYGKLFSAAPALHCKLLHRIENGAFVIDHEEVTGFPGRDGVVYAVAIYEVVDGRIARGWFAG